MCLRMQYFRIVHLVGQIIRIIDVFIVLLHCSIITPSHFTFLPWKHEECVCVCVCVYEHYTFMMLVASEEKE